MFMRKKLSCLFLDKNWVTRTKHIGLGHIWYGRSLLHHLDIFNTVIVNFHIIWNVAQNRKYALSIALGNKAH